MGDTITVGDISGSGIAIGKGAKVSIKNSFNSLDSATQVEDELKQLLKQLIEQIETVNSKTDSKDAQSMARDAEILVSEADQEEPREPYIELSLDSIAKAAKKLGEIATPIIDTVNKLMPLLLPAAAAAM